LTGRHAEQKIVKKRGPWCTPHSVHKKKKEPSQERLLLVKSTYGDGPPARKREGQKVFHMSSGKGGKKKTAKKGGTVMKAP